MIARMIYISSLQRINTLAGEYKLSQGMIREGDFLFSLYEISSDEQKELQEICLNESPFLKIIYKNPASLLIKVIPEQELFGNLSKYPVSNPDIDAFIKKLTSYFQRNDRIIWNLSKKTINFQSCPLIMGILNVTPDSFSDGGKYFEVNRALEHALEMIADGADIIDVGGESTRPGAAKVTVEEELKRVVPVIEGIRKHSDVLISIDSYKSAVADTALAGGADIINDISGMSFNDDMLAVIEKYRCPYVVMHIQGSPQTMQQNPDYNDVQNEVYNFLLKKCEVIAPYNDGRLIIDPGFGFGKRTDHNLLLLRDLVDFTFIGKPLLVGVSRKSFIGKILDTDVNDRFTGTIVTQLYAALKRAAILRVHDVRETNQAKKVLNQILDA